MTNNNSKNSPNNFRFKFPYKITDLPLDKETKQLYTNPSVVSVGPEKWFFPSTYRNCAEHCYSFKPRPDDVWIVTFPRSGTTWTQEITWLLANNMDYEKAANITLLERYPFLEYNLILQPQLEDIFHKNSEEKLNQFRRIATPSWENLEKTTERRFIKTHLPLELLPPDLLEIGCKVIYVARNPKDVAVSYYHLNILTGVSDSNIDFPLFWNQFEKNAVIWAPFWTHLEQAWQNRKHKNLLFLFYEDLNKDLKQSTKRIANFLDVKYTEDQYNILLDHLKIENFRKNKSVNGAILKELGVFTKTSEFIRAGKTRGWTDYFSDDLNIKANKWIKENLKKTDLRFPNITF